MLTKEECYLYDDFVINNQSYIYPMIGNKFLNHISTGVEKKILDLGTGPGYLTSYLSKKSSSLVIAADINEVMLEISRNVVKNNGGQNVLFEIQDVHCLTYDNNSIDAIVSYSCLHHWVEPVVGLKECYRVLKPGGKIVIVDTDPTSLHSLSTLKRYIDDKYMDILEEAFLESYTQKHIREMLKQAGIRKYTIQDLSFSDEEFMEVIDEIDQLPTIEDPESPTPKSWILIIEK